MLAMELNDFLGLEPDILKGSLGIGPTFLDLLRIFRVFVTSLGALFREWWKFVFFWRRWSWYSHRRIREGRWTLDRSNVLGGGTFSAFWCWTDRESPSSIWAYRCCYFLRIGNAPWITRTNCIQLPTHRFRIFAILVIHILRLLKEDDSILPRASRPRSCTHQLRKLYRNLLTLSLWGLA